MIRRRAQAARPWYWRKFLAWLLLAFLLGFAVARATSAPSVLSSEQTSRAVSGSAATLATPGADGSTVRAGNGAPSVELEARAGMESRHDRWAESEERRGSAVPHYSPASDHPSDAPAATPARTISDLIRSAATEFSVDPARLEAVARCESSLLAEPRVGQAQEMGWFQWQPRTWEWLARISGLGYTWRDIVDERAQARLTAWAFANGYASHWSCAK